MAWVQSGEYDRIVAGQYPTRDQQADARKEAGDAVEFYKQRFAKVIKDSGANEKFTGAADKAGERVADAAEQARRVGAQEQAGAVAAAVAGHAHDHHDHGGHAHSHAPSADADRRWLGVALGLILAFMVAEVVAGVLADSLALLSDAAHMLTDAGAIALALVAARLAARPPGGGFTYGLGRAEILSAQINGATLLVLAGIIAWEAVQRIADPPDVDGAVVLAVGLAGAARERRRRVGARPRGAALAQHRGRPRARPHRPLRLAGRRARRPARDRRRLRRGGRHRRAAGRRADDPLRRRRWSASRPACCSRPRRAGSTRRRSGTRSPRIPGIVRGPRPARLGGHLRLPSLSAHVLVPAGEDCHARRAELEHLLADRSGSSTRRCRSSTRRATRCSTSPPATSARARRSAAARPASSPSRGTARRASGAAWP